MSNAEKIIELYLTNPDISLKTIARIVGVKIRTVRLRVSNYKLNISNERKQGSGGRPGPADPKMEAKVLKKIKDRPCDSMRDLARKCGTSLNMIQRVKARNDLVSCVKQKKAAKTIKQFNEGISRAKKLSEILQWQKNSCLAMDDETYVKKDFAQIPGKQYNIKKRGDTPDESITSVAYDKFPAKKMVWQAICECGLRCTPFFCVGTMTADIYINECLKKRLLPFIRKHNCPLRPSNREVLGSDQARIEKGA